MRKDQINYTMDLTRSILLLIVFIFSCVPRAEIHSQKTQKENVNQLSSKRILNINDIVDEVCNTEIKNEFQIKNLKSLVGASLIEEIIPTCQRRLIFNINSSEIYKIWFLMDDSAQLSAFAVIETNSTKCISIKQAQSYFPEEQPALILGSLHGSIINYKYKRVLCTIKIMFDKISCLYKIEISK